MKTGKTVLVLGASGGIGGEVARQLRDAGWKVRAMKRGAGVPIEQREGIEWRRGDAMNAADVAAAAEGCAVIVHAVNPPGYRRWAEDVLPMLDNTIAAAAKQGATVVLPGTVYNFGPDAFPLLAEDAPQRPLTRKGAVRVEMERRLRAYAERGGQVIVVRAGDFFGPKAGNSWFAQGMVRPGKPVTRILNPARAGHQWAYLPDVARTMQLLLEKRERLDAFADFHMAGHWDPDGTELAEAASRAVWRRTGRVPKITAFPWWLLGLVAPFNVTMREMQEMRYLWEQPLRMSNAKLVGVLGQEPHTPLDEAMEAALEGLGCLPARGDGFSSTLSLPAAPACPHTASPHPGC